MAAMTRGWNARAGEHLIPDLSGQVAVVTGANGGLGRQTARVLAEHGARVLMAARDRAKVVIARDAILADLPGADLEVLALDLASLASVRRAAAEVVHRIGTVDLLVNNAGVMAPPYRLTEDGFELQFGVNHLGHWAFTAGLMPALLGSGRARVVTVTSVARHQRGADLDPENLRFDSDYDPWLAYSRSKLANYHFGIGLQRAFDRADAPVASLLAHPGLSRSGLQETTVAAGGGGRSARFWSAVTRLTGMPVAEGVMPQIRALTDPNARGGELYAPRWGTFGPAVRRPLLRPGAEAAIATLWRVSQEQTGIAMPV